MLRGELRPRRKVRSGPVNEDVLGHEVSADDQVKVR